MAWKYESRRHSLARKGVKTADGKKRWTYPYTRYWYEMQIALDRYLGLTEIGLDVEEVKRIKDAKYPRDLEYTFELNGREFTVQFTFLRREGIIDLKFVPESDDEIYEEMYYQIEQERKNKKKAKGLKDIETPYRVIPDDIKKWNDELLHDQHENIMEEFLMLRKANVQHDDPAWKYVIVRSTMITTEMDKRGLKPKPFEQIKIDYANKLGIDKSEFDLKKKP